MLSINVPYFINAHFECVKKNNGNGTFLPYLERVEGVKGLLTTCLSRDGFVPGHDGRVQKKPPQRKALISV
jgi:hypothetical protein